MKNTKLLVVLQKLTTRDRSWFLKYVQADFFNKHPNLRRLAEIVVPLGPDFDSPELDKRLVFKTIFGETKTYNELKINNLVSDLLVLLYEFLAYCQYEKHATQPLFFQLDALLELELDDQFSAVARRFFQKETVRTEQSAAHWQAWAGYFERLDRQFTQSGRREFDDHLQQQNDALDLAFWLEKMRLACGMLSRNQVVNGSYRPTFLEEIKGWLRARPDWSEQPAVQIYEAAIALLEHLQTVDYQRLKSLLAAHADRLSSSETFALYNYALNFCIRQINAGRADWYAEALDLYRVLLRRGVLFKNGHLSPWTYKNIVTAGLRTRDFEWTERFILDFEEKLPPADRANAHAYSLAALFYEKKDFAKALQTLQTVEFTDASYALGAKIIQLKSWFALGEAEALFSLIETMKKWLGRQSKMPSYGKRANLNFLKILKPIFVLKRDAEQVSKKEVARRAAVLRATMEKMEPLANKDWLNEIVVFE